MRTYHIVATSEIIYHNDNFDRLVSDAKRYTHLCDAEETALLEEYFRTDNAERKIAIRNTIVESHSKFMLMLAHFWGGTDGSKVCDMFSLIGLAFCHCIDMFDLSKGVKFITFAKDWARSFVAQYRRDKEALVRNGKDSEVKRATAFANRIYVSEGRTATTDEILDYLNAKIAEENKERKSKGMKPRKMNDLHDLVALTSTSLETPMGEDGNFESVGEFATTTASEIACQLKEESEYRLALINKCLLCLTDKEKQVISLAYGIALDGRKVRAISDQKIADALRLGKERVRQIRKGAESKMREFALRHKMLA